MEDLSIYIHIPFCKSKCYYCDFLSFNCNHENVSRYFNALMKELDILYSMKENYKIKTIFIGGGTPTFVDVDYIQKVLEKINKILIISEDAEITIEANPGTIHEDNIILLKKAGINRLSIGLQCWQDELLKKIGRIHTKDEFLYAYEAAVSSGINNINVDLIFALPSQTTNQWQETLEKTVELKPAHISCYGLTIEEGTVFKRMYDKGGINIDEDIERKMYHMAIRYLEQRGYLQYEISNFSKPKMECLHNLTYWQLKPYYGFGLGAHSYFENYRFNNEKSINKYIEKVLTGDTIYENKTFCDEKTMKEEYLFLGLRKTQGISKVDYESKFNNTIEKDYNDEIKKLVSLGLLNEDIDNLRLTEKGLDLANQVFVEFIK